MEDRINMIESEKMSISTKALVAVLAQSLSVKKASEVAKEYNISKKEIKQIIEMPQSFIDNDKYEDQQLSLLKESIIISRKANKLGRFENLDKIMLIYPSKGSNVIVEWIYQKKHTFYHTKNSELSKLIGDFYDFDSTTLSEDPLEIIIEIPEDQFEEIHHVESDLLDKIAEEGDFHPKITLFLKDFKRNNQQASKNSFQKRSDNSKKWKLESGMLLVPGENYIWSVEIDESEKGKYLLVSVPVNLYIESAQQSFIDLLKEVKPQTSQKKRNKSGKNRTGKVFSFKRGFSFFWKSNFFLFAAILIFFINKSSWISDDGTQVISFALVWEAFILICSFIACFRDRE
ncbi:hypothetical protein [Terribacillus saccharophilus]|uniref:hypothetical protein n=1 Tax=Terribacillus saccharophilus TaxID=361277 RepID=UPI002989A286|nr:hypothetical protein [Terribacillus saccharophilus]MCM3226125.1 hypothetical protein [Terribacillus saccharophilus]